MQIVLVEPDEYDRHTRKLGTEPFLALVVDRDRDNWYEVRVFPFGNRVWAMRPEQITQFADVVEADH